MRKIGIFLTTLMLACCLAACNLTPQPKEFKSETGRFMVMSPAVLQETVQPVATEGGKIDLHLFTGQEGDIAYIVSYCDYAPEVARPDNALRMLAGARDGAVAHVHGKLLGETTIDLAGHPGLEVTIEAAAEDRPPVTIKSRLIMVQNRLYQVTVVSPRGQAQDKGIDAFLQSFKLLGQ